MPKSLQKQDLKKVHYNVPQLLFVVISAAITILLWGRATGKTEGPGALFTLRNNLTMPRSLNGIITTTYDKILTVVVPALIKGWEKLGYFENLHFFVRKSPPDSFAYKKAYRQPKKIDHFIWWFNGSGNPLLSLDRPEISVGFNLDSLYGDEARFFKRNLINNALLTVRGNAEHFGKLSQHGSILFTTDIPQDSRGAWLFDYENEVDQETIDLILKIQAQIIEIQDKLENANSKVKAKLRKELDYFEDSLNELRKGLVYVSYASTLDNIHALGLNVVKNFKRTLTDFEFNTSVLSKKISKIEKNFYPLLNDEVHGYDAGNHDYMDNLSIDFRSEVKKDSHWDSDLLAGEPIDIAFDYNSAINSSVIGQDRASEYRMLNCIYTLGRDDKRLKDLCVEIDRYYSPHKYSCNKINYYYDHTAIGTNASTSFTFKDEVVQTLTELGWDVNPIYIGMTPLHHSRFLFFGHLLAGDNPKLPQFRFNRGNCQQLITAMNNAGVLTTKDGYEKDKRPEKDPNVKPEDAPHLTDALDTLLYGQFVDRLKDQPEFHDNIIA